MASLFGLDAMSSPSVSAMQAAGVKFIARYLSYVNNLTRAKILTADEAMRNAQGGIATVSNYEWYESRCSEGYNAGVADAQIAQGQHVAAGGPSSRPIYFSVDHDYSVGSVSSYFQGVNAVIGAGRTGVYGSYGICKDLKTLGLVRWCWQTYAWSGNLWYPDNNFEQYSNNHSLGGVGVDYNRSKTNDFGQWYPVSFGRQPDGVGDSEFPQMPFIDDPNFAALAWRVEALINGRSTVAGGPTKGEKVVLGNLFSALTDAQVGLISERVANALAAAPHISLGDADIPAIETAVKQALKNVFVNV